jgi:hypothetical protein
VIATGAPRTGAAIGYALQAAPPASRSIMKASTSAVVTTLLRLADRRQEHL